MDTTVRINNDSEYNYKTPTQRRSFGMGSLNHLMSKFDNNDEICKFGVMGG